MKWDFISNACKWSVLLTLHGPLMNDIFWSPGKMVKTGYIKHSWDSLKYNSNNVFMKMAFNHCRHNAITVKAVAKDDRTMPSLNPAVIYQQDWRLMAISLIWLSSDCQSIQRSNESDESSCCSILLRGESNLNFYSADLGKFLPLLSFLSLMLLNVSCRHTVSWPKLSVSILLRLSFYPIPFDLSVSPSLIPSLVESPSRLDKAVEA